MMLRTKSVSSVVGGVAKTNTLCGDTSAARVPGRNAMIGVVFAIVK